MDEFSEGLTCGSQQPWGRRWRRWWREGRVSPTVACQLALFTNLLRHSPRARPLELSLKAGEIKDTALLWNSISRAACGAHTQHPSSFGALWVSSQDCFLITAPVLLSLGGAVCVVTCRIASTAAALFSGRNHPPAEWAAGCPEECAWVDLETQADHITHEPRQRCLHVNNGSQLSVGRSMGQRLKYSSLTYACCRDPGGNVFMKTASCSHYKTAPCLCLHLCTAAFFMQWELTRHAWLVFFFSLNVVRTPHCKIS